MSYKQSDWFQPGDHVSCRRGIRMIALIQRVSSASVSVDEEEIAAIGQGLLVLLGVEKSDDSLIAERLADKILKYRVFSDAEGKMNRSVLEINGSVLLVPQFTLAADTRKGLRPSFSTAAAPEKGFTLFSQLVDIMREKGGLMPHNQAISQAGEMQDCAGLAENGLQTGRFGADMAVALVNDGPVTFYLEMKR